MANTTNFGWETPDDTDLVKDGAAAMRTLGGAIDTSLVDLKGGTTDQVLAKNSNTDMDFKWVTTDDTNAIQNAIVDAKGDLIAASAADTPARLAVGSNGDTLLADSAATTGLRWQPTFAAGKNKIINGDFGIWQRGTSITLPNNTPTYGADRFIATSVHSSGTATFSQQSFTAGTAPVAGYEGTFFGRLTAGAAGSPSAYLDLSQRIEDVRTFAGQTITLSFWAKASVNTSLNPLFRQNFGSGGSANADTSSSTATATTSWARFSFTVTLPSISGKTIGTGNYLQVYLFNGNYTNSQTIDIWGVQVEAGSVATAFQTATGTLAGELAACQRYYWRSTATGAYSWFGQGFGISTSNILYPVTNPVPMRTAASSIEVGNLISYDGGFTGAGTITIQADESSQLITRITYGGSGFTANRPYGLIANNNSAAYVGASAEL